MNAILATVKPIGTGGLFIIEPLSRTDPGFGSGKPPVDPGYDRPSGGHPEHGLPGFGHADNDLPGMGGNYPSHGLPGYGHPDHGLPGYGHVTPPIVIPAPPEINPPPTKPIVIPKPSLPMGSGIVVPFPADATVPTPTTAPAPGTAPYILWYGPGTKSSVVYLPPSAVAEPK